MGLLDFLTNVRHEVGQFDEDDIFVDTCSVNDAEQPFETAVAHPRYNDSKLVIVELYATEEEAKKGHDKWVKTMTAKDLPTTLKDVSTAETAKLVDLAAGEKDWRTKERR